MSAALVALDTLRSLGDLTEAEIQFVLAQSRGETGWGHGWASPSQHTIDESKQFGLTGFEGTGSFNWGAVHGTGSAGSFLHVDHRTDGKPYVTPFKKYTSDQEGARDVVDLVLKPNVRAAIARSGSIADAVQAMKDNFYFEATVGQYGAMVTNNYKALTAELGWTPLLKGAASSGAVPLSQPPQAWPSFSGPFVPPVLVHGNSGLAVALWQRYLNFTSIVGTTVNVTGVFDDLTLDATRTYQSAKGLRPDGIVGALTWATVLA